MSDVPSTIVDDGVAEPSSDLLSGGRPTLVFDGVVQEGRDNLVLGAAVLPTMAATA